jgi:hypothetical protein
MATLKNTVIDSTESIRLPVGTTAERLASPSVGMMRYNTDEEVVEIYDGEDWAEVGGGTSVSSLYNFTTATFTSGGNDGHLGPSLTQARNGLSGPETNEWKNNTEFFNTTDGIQLWTVPADGTYRIEAWGSQGGDDGNANRGGLGARMRGDFQLTQGEIVRILVGQRGGGGGSGAGGGTYVFKNASDALPLIVAGGGGGWGSSANFTSGGTTGTSGLTGSGGSFAGGSNGNGGVTSTDSGWGGAGAGWLTNGTDGGIYGGLAFAPRNGAAGGNIFQVGGDFGCLGGYGGFGGGGGGGCNGGGGGGGYSGGGTSGGGGGSFNGGTNQSNSAGVRTGNGQVTITLL